VIADNLTNGVVAHRIFSAVKHILNDDEGNLADRIACRLVFETSFGDRSVARDTLEQLTSVSNGVTGRSRAGLLILGAQAAELLGMLGRSEELAALAYRLSEEHSYGTQACSAARKLAWHSLDRGDYANTVYWYDIARSWVERGQFSSFRADVFGLEAELLIHRGEYTAAENTLKKCPVAWSKTVHPRWKLGVLSGQCAVWLATGELQKCAAVLDEFRDLFMRIWHEEGHDVFAARYFRLLEALGHNEQAKIALQNYVATRLRRREDFALELQLVMNSRFVERSSTRTPSEATC
jgi:hypothetical protein